MKGLVKKAFTDKCTTLYHEVGKVVEFSDERFKELSAMGFVEVRADEVKPEEVSKAVEETAEETTKEATEVTTEEAPKKAKRTTKRK